MPITEFELEQIIGFSIGAGFLAGFIIGGGLAFLLEWINPSNPGALPD